MTNVMKKKMMMTMMVTIIILIILLFARILVAEAISTLTVSAMAVEKAIDSIFAGGSFSGSRIIYLLEL